MADAFEASSKLFRGFLSGVQRPRHHLDGLLDRIERTDSKLHAFVAVYAEAARAARRDDVNRGERGKTTREGVPRAFEVKLLTFVLIRASLENVAGPIHPASTFSTPRQTRCRHARGARPVWHSRLLSSHAMSSMRRGGGALMLDIA